MLEYDFNELDDDFITLWANYILWNDASRIIEPLERLAEMGQINAIQCWYLLKKHDETNIKIDAIVNAYRGGSFNEELAIAHREYDKLKPELEELSEQVAYYQEQGEALFKRCWNGGYGYSLPDDQNEYYIARDRMLEEYKNTEYAKHLVLAAYAVENACSNTKRATVFERWFEIYASNPIILDNDRIEKKTVKKARKILKNHVKDNPDDARAKFALAKNLIFFSDKAKEQIEGAEILTDLSKRPLSINNEHELGED